MAAQNPPINAQAFIVYITLQDFLIPGSYKANPTLAAGDVQVSLDGGAFANLTTLPTVTPAAGVGVKVSLSASEMTADNVLVKFIDQTSPKEWADFAICIQPTAGVWNVGKTGYALSAAGIQAVWDALTSALTTVGSIGKRLADDIDATISSRSTYAGGAVSSVTGSVGGNVNGSVGSVVGAVGSVTGAVGSVTGNVGGSVASVVADVGITQGAADKVWLSAARTLTSFGTLVADIWANASRTLTGIASGIIASGELNNIADAIFKRDWTAITGEAARSLLNAGRKLMNRVSYAAPTLTIYAEDDATPAYTQTVATDATQGPFKSLDTN